MLRPLFAAVAMHALIPSMITTSVGSPVDVASAAMRYADALLARLRGETPRDLPAHRHRRTARAPRPGARCIGVFLDFRSAAYHRGYWFDVLD